MTATNPVRLSVVIPAHNEAAYLPATLASLQRQQVPGGFEVVVVDNASTDNTAEVAERLGVTRNRAYAQTRDGSAQPRR